jgi:hypothetical protein
MLDSQQNGSRRRGDFGQTRADKKLRQIVFGIAAEMHKAAGTDERIGKARGGVD